MKDDQQFKKMDSEKLRKMIGRNLAEARKMAGLSQIQVMQRVWGRDSNKNRISEIEIGLVMPRTELVYTLCDLYKVCPSYVFGFSVEPTLDESAGRVNMLYSGLHVLLAEQVKNITSQLCNIGAQHIASMPKPHMLSLLDAAKAVYREYCSTDRQNLLAQHEPLLHAVIGLASEIRSVEQHLAVQMNSLEMRMHNITVEHDPDDGHVTIPDAANDDLHTPPQVKSKPFKLQVNRNQLSLLINAANNDRADPESKQLDLLQQQV